jgi:nicotinamidase-related amidase
VKSALLVIDVQMAMCSDEYVAFDIDRVVERINSVSHKARLAGAPVVFIQHEESEGLFAYGSAGWHLHTQLDVQPTDLRVRKTAPDSFHRTDLAELLAKHGIRRLIICGLQSEFCVDATVRRALALGYPVELLSDAHSTFDNSVLSAQQIIAHHNLTLANMNSFGPSISAVPAASIAFQGQ